MAVQIVTEPGAIIHISTINALWAYTNYVWLPNSEALALEDAIAVTVDHYSHNPGTGSASFVIWTEAPPRGDRPFSTELIDSGTPQTQNIEITLDMSLFDDVWFGFVVGGRDDRAITKIQLHK